MADVKDGPRPDKSEQAPRQEESVDVSAVLEQVMPSFLLFANSWGLINSFGSFHTAFQPQLLQSDDARSITYIGYVAALVTVLTPLAAKKVSTTYVVPTLVLGTVLVCAGTIATSIAVDQWQFIAAHGLLTGGGAGILLLTALKLLAVHSTQKPRLTLSIAAVGANIGGVLYPLFFDTMRSSVGGVRGARSLAATVFAISTLAFMIIRLRVRTGTLVTKISAAQTDKVANMSIVDFLRYGLVFFIPYHHLQTFAKCQCYPNWDSSVYTLITANVGGIAGLIALGVLPELVDEDIPWKIFAYVYTAGFAAAWAGARDSPVGLAIFSGLYGFVTSAFVQLRVLSLSPGVERKE